MNEVPEENMMRSGVFPELDRPHTPQELTWKHRAEGAEKAQITRAEKEKAIKEISSKIHYRHDDGTEFWARDGGAFDRAQEHGRKRGLLTVSYDLVFRWEQCAEKRRKYKVTVGLPQLNLRTSGKPDFQIVATCVDGEWAVVAS